MMNFVGMWTSFRSTLDSYISVVGRRFAVLIWIAAIAVLIWLFGPRLAIGDFAPLSPVSNRIIAIVALFLLWAIWSLVSWLRARRADKDLIDDIAESPEARAQAETKAEIDELRTRLRDAMAMMKKVVKRRSGYVYEFPWYLMMGAPGAGKTTLLTNSGLKFPLGDALGGEPVQGVGGTRSCNWWFTDQAILIDTAGRYTTQDTGHERDKAGFINFLKMLRKRRRAQPVNGVILTLSLTDLLHQPPETRLREIRAIRQRLFEVTTTINARIPVYIVLTKADWLAGFEQFFDSLGAEGREQVWGMTFPIDPDEMPQGLPAWFSQEYQNLTERLNGLLIERLQQEIDASHRGRIFRFPAQVAALHDSLKEIVEELTSSTGDVEAPLIRGMYFASATQEADFRGELGGTRSMNRSYFVNKLFGDVILGEAGLVARDQRVTRRQKIMQAVTYSLIGLAVLFLCGTWVSEYVVNRQALKQVQNDLTSYSEQARNIPVRDVRDTDFLRILPALDALSNVPVAFSEQEKTAPLGLPLHKAAIGLDQRSSVVNEYQGHYARALGAYLLPRYMVALQDRLKRDDLDDADAFETLKHYLSLGGLGPVDPDALLAQSDIIFAELYPGSGRRIAREKLSQHMEAMLERGEMPVMALDDALVEDARTTLRSRSPAQRAYDMLLSRKAARALGQWSPSQALGPAGQQVFARVSGAPLTQGVPGVFTRRGYQEVVLPQISTVSEIAANEEWVRGATGGAYEDQSASEIAADAVGLYWAEFTRHWRELLSDLVIRKANTLETASDIVSVIASESRPLERLANEIARVTWLTGPPIIPGTDQNTDIVEVGFVPTGVFAFDPLAAPDPYAALRRGLEVKSEGDEESNIFTPLTPLLENIYQQLSRASASNARVAEIFAAEGPLTSASQDLLTLGRRLPMPADQWVVGLASEVSQTTVSQARSSLAELWQSDGAEECSRAISGRYPFDPQASQEVTIADFTRMFGPNGLFQTFFDENLADMVDVSAETWRWTGGLGTTGISNDALQQFRNAAIIQKAFFPTASDRPQFTYYFELQQLQNTQVALIEIGGKSSFHGTSRNRVRTFAWPTEDREIAQLTLLPGSRNDALETKGPWAPFRLIGQGDRQPISDNEFDVRFNIKGRSATLRIVSGSVNNPFSLNALREFSCPESL